jgi:hypothetical protein
LRTYWHVALGLLLTLCLLWPLLAAPYFSHQDNVQTMRIYEMHQCILDLQIPCRWVPDLGAGYGNPLFNYYAPLPYYIGELFYVATHDIIVAAKLTFALGFVLPFIFTYLFASMLWGKLGGSLSAIFYVFAPYHARNMYIRGAMGELWAMAAFPFVFWAFLRLRQKATSWNSLLLGVALAVLIITHNLSAMLLLGVIALLSIVQLWSNWQFSYAKSLVLSGLWGLALSAFYLLPMLLETGFVHLETMTSNELNYAEQFQGLRTLLIERPWFLPSAGGSSTVYYQIGAVHLLAWALSLCAVYLCWKRCKDLRLVVLPLSLVILLSIYMITPASAWIWDRIGPLSYLQFPWRLLSLISLATATAAGATVLLARTRRGQLILWSVLVGLVVVLNVGYFRPERFLNVSQADLLSDGGWDNLRMYAIGDFLPKAVQNTPRSPTTAPYAQLSGQSVITDVQSGSDWIRFDASSPSEAEVQINKFDFPTWQVSVDGQPVAYEHDADSGVLKVALPVGQHTVEARLRDTPARIIANLITAAALIACALLCLRAALRGVFRKAQISGARDRHPSQLSMS